MSVPSTYLNFVSKCPMWSWYFSPDELLLNTPLTNCWRTTWDDPTGNPRQCYAGYLSADSWKGECPVWKFRPQTYYCVNNRDTVIYPWEYACPVYVTEWHAQMPKACPVAVCPFCREKLNLESRGASATSLSSDILLWAMLVPPDSVSLSCKAHLHGIEDY